jgi:hypothetical protein
MPITLTEEALIEAAGNAVDRNGLRLGWSGEYISGVKRGLRIALSIVQPEWAGKPGLGEMPLKPDDESPTNG